MTGDELEQMIRQNPTMNERFLLGRLDEALAQVQSAEQMRDRLLEMFPEKDQVGHAVAGWLTDALTKPSRES